MYIADRDNDRIVKTKIDGSGWTTIGGFRWPLDVFYDAPNPHPSNYSSPYPYPYSEILYTYGRGNKAGQIWDPVGYCFDKDRNLYILDKENCRIQKYNEDLEFINNIGEKALENARKLGY